jgi:hypothetical protein
VLSNGGNVLICGHQFMEIMWLFPFLNVSINSLVMAFFVHSTVRCGIYCQFLQEIKVNLSLCFIKLHTVDAGQY